MTMGFFPGLSAADYLKGLTPKPAVQTTTGEFAEETRTPSQQFSDFLSQVFPGNALSGWGRESTQQLQAPLQMQWKLGGTTGQSFQDWLAAGTPYSQADMRSTIGGIRHAAERAATGGVTGFGGDTGVPDISDAQQLENQFRLNMFDTPESQLAAIMSPLTGLGGLIAPGFRSAFQRTYADPALAAWNRAGLTEGPGVRPGSFLEFLRTRDEGLGALDPSRYLPGGARWGP